MLAYDDDKVKNLCNNDYTQTHEKHTFFQKGMVITNLKLERSQYYLKKTKQNKNSISTHIKTYQRYYLKTKPKKKREMFFQQNKCEKNKDETSLLTQQGIYTEARCGSWELRWGSQCSKETTSNDSGITNQLNKNYVNDIHKEDITSFILVREQVTSLKSSKPSYQLHQGHPHVT